MKRFEFRLHRVLALRRQQAEAHRARMLAITSSLRTLDEQKIALEADVAESSRSIRSSPLTGGDLVSLARFEAHIRRRCLAIAKKKSELDQHFKAEQLKLRETDRKIKLLEKLEEKRRAEWEIEADKEIESLAADAHLSRMQSIAKERRGPAVPARLLNRS